MTAQNALDALEIVLAGAALWLAWDAARLASTLRSQVTTLTNQVTDLHRLGERSAPVLLAAQLAALEQSLEVDRLALRKQLGKIWGRIGRDEIVSDSAIKNPLLGESVDPELEAILNLQRQYTNGGS
jgi:hypothetical protein